MSFCALAWGITTLGMGTYPASSRHLHSLIVNSKGLIQSCKGLYACRLLIGLFESGLIPSINVYIAMVYNQSERGKCSAVVFAFSAFSSAFGGVLVFGLTQIDGPGGFAGWRYVSFCPSIP